MMNTIRAMLLFLCISALPGYVTAKDILPEGDGSESGHVLFDLLYKVAPELRIEALTIMGTLSVTFPHLRDWQRGGRVLAFFRYDHDPERRSRLLVLRRTFPTDGSAPALSLDLCHARAHHHQWEGTVDYFAFSPHDAKARASTEEDCVCNDPETNWTILDQRAYTKEPTHKPNP